MIIAKHFFIKTLYKTKVYDLKILYKKFKRKNYKNNKISMINFWTREQYHKKIWRKKIIWKNNCPFCDWKNKNPEEILWKWKNLLIIYNIYPYSWDKNHLMIIPKKHRILYADLSNEEILEMKECHKFLKKYFWEKNYFSFSRETSNDESRSIEHLHIHFLVWKLQWKYLRKMLMDQWFPIKEYI